MFDELLGDRRATLRRAPTPGVRGRRRASRRIKRLAPRRACGCGYDINSSSSTCVKHPRPLSSLNGPTRPRYSS